MAEYEAYDEDVEVNGQTINSFLDAVMIKSKVKDILEEEGIVDPAPDKWYSQQAWLNAFKKIHEKTGDLTLKKIGRSIPENADWPSDIETIPEGLKSIDKAYHMNHRYGKIGNYKFEKTDEREGKIICDNPYPDPFDEGIIKATVEKFSDDSSNVKVEIDDSKPTRSEGANSTVFLIYW